MSKHLVVGASRGLGLAFARELLERDRATIVYATARNVATATQLQSLAQEFKDRVHILSLDTDSEESIKAAAQELQKSTDVLDGLHHFAGINPTHAPVLQMSAYDLEVHLKTNVIGSYLTIREFTPFVLHSRAKKPIINILSSHAGTKGGFQEVAGFLLPETGMDFWPLTAYGASKSALNYIALQLAITLNKKGIAVIAMNPGWVATDMGGPAAPLTPKQSCQGMLQVIDDFKIGDMAIFKSYDGSTIPW